LISKFIKNCIELYVCKYPSRQVENIDAKAQDAIPKLGLNIVQHVFLKNECSGSFDIYYGKFGKPFLKNNLFYFNISHSGEYTICGISAQEIGVDIQKVKKIIDRKILKSFFAPSELDMLDLGDMKDDLFTEIWTVKESYLKMLGTGLHKPLRSFSVVQYGTNYEIIDEEKRNCKLLVKTLYKDYKIAICSTIQSPDYKFVHLNASDLNELHKC
jgi:4'-phosphopantetheinyl transferase